MPQNWKTIHLDSVIYLPKAYPIQIIVVFDIKHCSYIISV